MGDVYFISPPPKAYRCNLHLAGFLSTFVSLWFEKILAGSFIQRSYFSLAVKVVGAQYVSTGDSDRVPQSGCREPDREEGIK